MCGCVSLVHILGRTRISRQRGRHPWAEKLKKSNKKKTEMIKEKKKK